MNGLRMLRRLLCCLTGVMMSVPLTAQEPRHPESRQRSGEHPRQRVIRIFNETSPPVGAPLPDLKCFAEDGSSFKLGNLKGRYTVLVFGCLT